METSAIGLRREGDRLILKYRSQRYGEEWRSLEYVVPLETTLCHFGGERFWFRCPALRCGRRVAILYSDRYFVCRHCLGLAYETQRQSRSDRAVSRAEAIGLQMAGWQCIFDGLPLRPKGMHKRTFRRLSREYAHYLRIGMASYPRELRFALEGTEELE